MTPRATGAVAVQGVRNKEETPFSLFIFFNFQLFFNSVRKETIDCDSNALPEGVDFKNHSLEVSCCSVERNMRKLANGERKDQDVHLLLETAE